MQPSGMVVAMRAALPAMLADIEALVTCESPSADLSAVARSADVVARIGSRLLGASPDRIVLDGRTHLRWRLGDGAGRVLLLGHHDTVWPVGSLAIRPFAVTGGVLRGPGCFDMKTGVVMALHAAAAVPDQSGVTILVTGDEELGSPSSRALIESEARECVATLVLEASADGGALKTQRKGTSLYEIRAYGKAAHAGLEPERGVNAAIELAHQVLRVGALADPHRGTTVTPTVVAAGTTPNTVAATGGFTVDVRVSDRAEQARIDAALRGLQPALPGARLEIHGGPNRPPLESHASGGVFRRAVRLADELGLEPLTCAAVGGASDGNVTAGLGIPTLDGLGAVGGGAHAEDEHVLIDRIAGRTALVAALVHDLLADTPSAPTNGAPGNRGSRP